MKNDCYEWQNKNNLSTTDKKEQLKIFGIAYLGEEYYSDGDLFAITDSDSKFDKEQILDTANTFHMCSNRVDFIHVKQLQGLQGDKNNEPHKIADAGKVRIKMVDEMVRTLGFVRHVTRLK